MSKIAFCFPGQGSAEAGMGRDIAEAVPSALAVFERGSRASGLDLERLCFHGEQEELLDTAVQQPALVATSLAILAAIRDRGIEPDYVVGHSVGEFAALAAANAMTDEEAIELVRERGIAMAEAAAQHPGSMAAILGPRRRGGRDALPTDPRRVARELQLPRSDRRLGRERRGRRVHRARAVRRRAACRQAAAFPARSTHHSLRAPPTACGRRSTA